MKPLPLLSLQSFISGLNALLHSLLRYSLVLCSLVLCSLVLYSPVFSPAWAEADTGDATTGDASTGDASTGDASTGDMTHSDLGGGILVQKGEAHISNVSIAASKAPAPLLVGLKKIAPPGWRAHKIGVLNTNRLVTWKSGKNWIDVLSEMSHRENLNVEVDWGRQIIGLSDVSSPPSAGNGAVSAGATGDTNMGSEPPVVGSVFSPATVSAVGHDLKSGTNSFVLVRPPTAKVWKLVSGKTLRANVESWARRAGWKVVWKGADYPIPASGELTGDFDANNGPVAQLLELYADADHPLMAEADMLNTPPVLYISNRTFTANRVPRVPMGDISSAMAGESGKK